MNAHPRRGFTLVELLMVIAILAIISTLAIQKLGGLKEGAREEVNRANVIRVANALETHAAANVGKMKFDKLDALVMYGASAGTAGSTAKLSSTADLMVYTGIEANRGLAPELVGASQNGYAATSAGILGTYYLQESEIRALDRDLGLRYVMRGYPATLSVPYYQFYGDDGTYVSGGTNSADTCSAVATSNKVGMAVAVVNPGATLNNAPVGPSIYKSCGMNVAYSGKTYKVMVNGADCDSNEKAFDALRAAGEDGGILMAFGLGENCALIGSSMGGLDSAPVSPVMDRSEYRRYIVLVRMVYETQAGRTGTTYTAKRAEFAGVMDPRGRTAAMLGKK